MTFERGLLAVLVPFLITMANAGAQHCGLHHPDRCTNTNQLILRHDVQTAIKDFIGDQPGNFFFPPSEGRTSAADDAIEALVAPTGQPTRLKDDSWFFAACRAHSCDEKGGIILAPDGRILAIAIVHYACGSGNCDKDATLAIFVANDSRRAFSIATLSDWAKNEVDAEPTVPGMRKAALSHIDVHVIAKR